MFNSKWTTVKTMSHSAKAAALSDKFIRKFPNLTTYRYAKNGLANDRHKSSGFEGGNREMYYSFSTV